MSTNHKHNWINLANEFDIEFKWQYEIYWCSLCGLVKINEFNIHGDYIKINYYRHKNLSFNKR